jgi:voltage-gated potassium channel Kch
MMCQYQITECVNSLAEVFYLRTFARVINRSKNDAIWYTYVTITTVGYGDRYPVTQTGRVLGLIIMTAGVGLFGTFTGYLANIFLAPPRKKKEEQAQPASGPETP